MQKGEQARGGAGKTGMGRKCQAACHAEEMSLCEDMLMMTWASADPGKRAKPAEVQQ